MLGRKNSLFYKTEHGAAIGDLLMSLIESCGLNGVSAWDYLLAVASNPESVRGDPQAWLPWNYTAQECERKVA